MITKINDLSRRWLVVDDNPEVLALTCKIIEQLLGIRPVAFTSAAAALGAVQGSAGPVELVLTDLEMPNMTGLEFCQQLRRLSPDTSVVLMTGTGSVSDHTAVEMGFDGFVQKPFCLTRMVKVLTAAWQKTSAQFQTAALA